MSNAVHTALTKTDWADLARQKLALLELQGEIEQITETERKDADQWQRQQQGSQSRRTS